MIDLTETDRLIVKHVIKALRDETQWTQGALARTSDGPAVSVGDERAAQWCALGRLYQLAPETQADWIATAYLETNDVSIGCVNDYEGREAVIAGFERLLE